MIEFRGIWVNFKEETVFLDMNIHRHKCCRLKWALGAVSDLGMME